MQIRKSAIATGKLDADRLAGSPVPAECLLLSPLTNLPPAALDHVAQYFRTLAEPMRLRILNVLGTGEMSVSDIAEQVDSSVANVSRHLAQLARHGLVARTHQGTSVLYRIEDPTVHELCELVCGSIARRFDQASEARVAINAALAHGDGRGAESGPDPG